MARTARVPLELRNGPFTVAEARRAGIHHSHLEKGPWRRLAPRTWVWSRLADRPELLLEAAALRLPPSAVFSGRTALWLHGLDVAPYGPVDVTVPKGVMAARAGMRVRRGRIGRGDVVLIRGFRATSVCRSLRDACGGLALVEAVVLADMALHTGCLELEELDGWVRANPATAGIKRLREVGALARNGAESPMETRLRLLLVQRGLPCPELQVPIHTADGRFAGRVDLYYREQRLAIEYDGATHRDSLVRDNRRQNLLLAAGVTLLRFCADDFYGAPDDLEAQVRARLRAPAATPMPAVSTHSAFGGS